ncbi:hypothetical protein [Dyadobacter arcticus]|uniref:Uncharacterized protein n=1 Tax=Dyadobacter arcticus TaxID=1078754 RepID=A0ABX0UP42_9BACT|nr:hypothetical protein [Dyadobacter arcticus]NIJ54758.1 hypothetical protein [Dyadobacter arcticus]
MKTEIEKHSVISLSDESFKHYLVQRYSNDPEMDLKSTKNWVQLYNHAKNDIEKSGGRITGYEMVDEVLVSHEGVHSQWPLHWMWVLQFNTRLSHSI